jgi:hypothetical protein
VPGDDCHTPAMSKNDGLDTIIADVEKGLRADGWADHTSVSRELNNWARLANRVGRYPMTVDDYTNDLCSRDYLELVLRRVPTDARPWLSQSLAPLDDAFRGGTVDDDRRVLARFFRIDRDSAWWWTRIPAAGPLAEYLASADHE